MRLTAKARAVLAAAAELDTGIGANHIAAILGINCGQLTGMRGGQYAGKLIRAGWLASERVWYRGKRGHDIYSHTSYHLTKKGAAVLKVAESTRGSQSTDTKE